jgi:hypothetical protein
VWVSRISQVIQHQRPTGFTHECVSGVFTIICQSSKPSIPRYTQPGASIQLILPSQYVRIFRPEVSWRCGSFVKFVSVGGEDESVSLRMIGRILQSETKGLTSAESKGFKKLKPSGSAEVTGQKTEVYGKGWGEFKFLSFKWSSVDQEVPPLSSNDVITRNILQASLNMSLWRQRNECYSSLSLVDRLDTPIISKATPYSANHAYHDCFCSFLSITYLDTEEWSYSIGSFVFTIEISKS